MILYAKLSNALSKKALFYVTCTPFFLFYALFCTVIYPNRHHLMPDVRLLFCLFGTHLRFTRPHVPGTLTLTSTPHPTIHPHQTDQGRQRGRAQLHGLPGAELGLLPLLHYVRALWLRGRLGALLAARQLDHQGRRGQGTHARTLEPTQGSVDTLSHTRNGTHPPTPPHPLPFFASVSSGSTRSSGSWPTSHPSLRGRRWCSRRA